jgi:peptidoglycan/xylan/chitin deacetylase (PgdA/CDA1 family)
MRSPYAHAWLPLARGALSVVGGRRLTILIYHRVHRETDALFPGIPDARRFDEEMAWLGKMLRVLPLSEAIEMHHERRLPPRAGAITFDDGYADNADVALPILKRHRLHATFFVASGFLDGGRMWNDTIIESVRRAPGTMLDFTDLGLGKLSIATPQQRRSSIDALIRDAKYLTQGQRDERVRAIAARACATLPTNLMMRSDQVRTMHRAGMEIGAHTVTHPILARLEWQEAQAEIAGGRMALESLLGAKVTLFAYPNGKPGVDYGAEHVKIVRDLGFSAALSTRAAPVDDASDRYELPRFTPWGTSCPRFAADLLRTHVGHRLHAKVRSAGRDAY